MLHLNIEHVVRLLHQAQVVVVVLLLLLVDKFEVFLRVFALRSTTIQCSELWNKLQLLIFGEAVKRKGTDVIGAYTHRDLHWNGHAHASLSLILVQLAVVDSSVDELELDFLALFLSHNQKFIVEDIRAQGRYDPGLLVVPQFTRNEESLRIAENLLLS